MDIFDSLGLVGVCFSVYSYARVQWQRDFAKRISYSIYNLIASILIGVALIVHWSLAFAVITGVWGVISLYGIYRCTKYMSRSKLIETRLHKIKRS